ncbi:MAG: DUF1365 domain-containing protein [Limisphaerales bacterium]
MVPRPTTNDAPLRSCLYEARVMHHRLEPRVHHFEYGIFLACLDLDELDALDARLRFFSRNRRNWLEFRDSDHLPYPESSGPKGQENRTPKPDIKRALQAWLEQQGVRLTDNDRVLLVTLPRIAGYVFNPVSFYFCTKPSGDALCAVAEVGNTFGELKPYLVPLEAAPSGQDGQQGPTFRCVVPKHYYVSPFTALDVCFDFQLRTPGPRLRIAVNDVSEGRNLLLTTLNGSQRPITDREILRLSLRYPLVTLKVISAIHWQALRLWLKRVPWYAKSHRRDLQRGVFRAHSSLAHPDSNSGPNPSTKPG